MDSSPSSEEDENDAVSLDSTSKRLDRKLSVADASSHVSPLPEFEAKVGGSGMFRVPTRAAVDPTQPPRLELRLQPLRETQIGGFLRTIVSTESQLWAGAESSVRVWRLKELYSAASPGQGEGDVEAAPFWESVETSAVMCLVCDEGNHVVWSGHRDGRIRCWSMDSIPAAATAQFKDMLSWQAHRGPVLSLVMGISGRDRRVAPLGYGRGRRLRKLYL